MTVFFDLGNVLLFFSHEKMYSQLSKLTQISMETLRELFLNKGVFTNYELGKVSTDEVYQRLLSLSPCSFSLLEAMRAASDIFIPNHELWPIVEELKKRNVRLILLSNTNESHFNFAYSNYPILKLFDEHILSFQVGACKPDPAIFQRALQKAKGKAFYTDDIPDFVEAARNAGLDAEVYTDPSLLKDQLHKRSFV